MFALVGPLLSADTRARWKRLATMKKRRETLHEDLDFDSFDPRFRRTVEARDATPSSLANELRQMGALNQCTVVAIGHWAEPWQAPFEER